MYKRQVLAAAHARLYKSATARTGRGVCGALYFRPRLHGAGAQNLPAPFFPGRFKAGAAQPLQNSGACRGVAASQEEYAAAPGAACACRTIPERRLFSSRPSAAGGLLHPVPEAKAFYRLPPPDTPAACPQWEFCAPHNKMLHKKRRRKSAPALLSFRLFAPCFQCQGYSTSQQGYRKRALHEDICLNAGFYSNSTVAGRCV